MDQDSKSFHEFCLETRNLLHIISAGLEPVPSRVPAHFLGLQESNTIATLANDASFQ